MGSERWAWSLISVQGQRRLTFEDKTTWQLYIYGERWGSTNVWYLRFLSASKLWLLRVHHWQNFKHSLTLPQHSLAAIASTAFMDGVIEVTCPNFQFACRCQTVMKLFSLLLWKLLRTWCHYGRLFGCLPQPIGLIKRAEKANIAELKTIRVAICCRWFSWILVRLVEIYKVNWLLSRPDRKWNSHFVSWLHNVRWENFVSARVFCFED